MLCMVLVLSGAVRADSYEYDELGNLKTLTTPRGARAYTYDEIQRLDTETGYTGDRDHAYDLNGNRTTDGASAPGTPTTATYTSNTNRIATINGAAVTIDAAGQITNDGLNSYTWDDAGRLKTVSRGGQLRATYHYDHKHRRTRKVTTAASPQGAQTVVYHYDDQDRLIAETTPAGVPIRSYAWSDGNLLGQVEYVPNATNTGYAVGRVLYYGFDHLGTPRQARERAGPVVWRWESDGYGNTLPEEDPDGNGQKTYVYLRFPGQYFDEESGLHYNWHRYYVPRLGRYLSSDPIGVEGGINTYAYVEGNPLSRTDPLGLWTVTLSAYAGLGFGVVVSYDKGTLEIVSRIGAGLGGNFNFDTRGKPSPHARNCGNGYIARGYADAAANAKLGFFSVGPSGTWRSGNVVTDRVGGDYIDGTPPDALIDLRPSYGFDLGGSIGIEGGSYSNW